VNGTGLHDVRNGTSGLQYEENGAMFHGFGFLPYLLDTHFDHRGRLGRIVPAQLQTKHDLAIGIDEPACLYYNNGIGTVYGKGGVFFTDITKATRNVKTYFNINNVLLSYLTAGDTYDFKQKLFVPSPTKHLITAPVHKTHQDSNDILSSYECTAILNHLIDQVPLFNVGKTKTPKAFPHTTPTFKLTFQKDNQTQGYFSTSEKLYMVSQALIHFSY
jgi:cyanophycinase